MKEIILTSIILIVSIITSAGILEFRGIILKPKFKEKVKFYTSLNEKDYCTTIEYKGSKKDNENNIKCTFEITENQNNKNLKTYTVTLKNNDTLKINNTYFKFLIFRYEYIFLKTEKRLK
jgi:hypothetical protein